MKRGLLSCFVVLPLLLGTMGVGCSSPSDQPESQQDDLNYRSTAGLEYALTTPVTFTPTADITTLEGEARDAALVAKANALRMTVASAITAEFDRIWPEEKRLTREGLSLEFRQASAAISDLTTHDNGETYTFTFSAEVSGITNLLQRLPVTVEGVRTYLPVPANIGGQNVTLQIDFTKIERSLNAYPKYLEMFEDGFDIAVHVGGDHTEPPKDIDHARSVYDDLIASGFQSPVSNFDALKIDSGPLKGSISVLGNRVEVRVRIVHANMSTADTRQLLIDAYKDSMKNADVVIYDGHAGRRLDYSGIVVAYQPARVAIPATAFKDIEASSKQQVYLFNGCETYTGYQDELYKNPAKNTENTDVITTGNFAALQAKANQVIAFVHALIDQKSGNWIPRSWDSVLGKMNSAGERSWVHVYGVHGIDDNPKVSPLADPASVGQPCARNSDCGAPDSRCLSVSSYRQVCGIACADSAGCPAGTKCLLPVGRSSVDDYQCVAR